MVILDIFQLWAAPYPAPLNRLLPWAALATDIRDVMNGQSLPPNVGDRWRLNLYRWERPRVGTDVTGEEPSAWSPVGDNDFHRPDRFGWLTFVGVPTAVEAEPCLTARLGRHSWAEGSDRPVNGGIQYVAVEGEISAVAPPSRYRYIRSPPQAHRRSSW